MVPQILESLVSNVLTVVSRSCHKYVNIHVQYQCFGYAMTWENDHQRSQKLPLNEIDVQMAPVHLCLIILIVFMICIMKKAQ